MPLPLRCQPLQRSSYALCCCCLPGARRQRSHDSHRPRSHRSPRARRQRSHRMCQTRPTNRCCIGGGLRICAGSRRQRVRHAVAAGGAGPHCLRPGTSAPPGSRPRTTPSRSARRPQWTALSSRGSTTTPPPASTTPRRRAKLFSCLFRITVFASPRCAGPRLTQASVALTAGLWVSKIASAGPATVMPGSSGLGRTRTGSRRTLSGLWSATVTSLSGLSSDWVLLVPGVTQSPG